ncbi:MAG TPA: hypothetical protein VH477_19340 [Bryobacteraceae bacterium]
MRLFVLFAALFLSAAAGVAQDTRQKTPPQPAKTREQIAAEQIKQQERQRILGVIPIFNVSNIPDAVPMTPRQKFRLAMRSALDPATFFIAGADAGISQWQNDFSGYGQGAQGYFKRWGASYADTFDSALLGNAVFPSLLHQDPRYFRKGTGSFGSRLWYAVLTTVRTKGDNGRWQPNYSNILGNIAAGGVANLYYPSTDRGVGLTFERAFTVTAEGAIGGFVLEFWPDISRKFSKKK